MSKILVIPDLHIPFEYPSSLAFCQDLMAKYSCTKVIGIGDIFDFHAISRFENPPESPSALNEYELALKKIKQWNRVFPKLNVCFGNHENRLIKQAAESGIPASFLKSLNTLFETPNWKWDTKFIEDGILFTHGTGYGGQYHAVNMMNKLLCSVVAGHVHSCSSIYWKANPFKRIFAVNTGCLVDDRAIAFAYATDTLQKSILSAVTVIDGIPQLHILPCGRGEKYSRERFTHKRRR